MNISYLQNSKSNNATWKNITRDERHFCSELFHHLKVDQKGFVSLIKKGRVTNSKRLEIPENIDAQIFDIGYEVCFYRDLLKWHGIKIGTTDLPHKRTFDLALFSEDAIIIIEAKAQQGFDTKQLKEFKKDKKFINKLFKKIHRNEPQVFIVGLYSSNYSPSSNTVEYFDSIIKWSDIAEKYPDSKDIFIHANDLYPNKKSKASNPVGPKKTY